VFTASNAKKKIQKHDNKPFIKSIVSLLPMRLVLVGASTPSFSGEAAELLVGLAKTPDVTGDKLPLRLLSGC
jgi:hypothetical protein